MWSLWRHCRKKKITPKSLGDIVRELLISVQRFMASHQTVAVMFESGSKWCTSWHCHPKSHAANYPKTPRLNKQFDDHHTQLDRASGCSTCCFTEQHSSERNPGHWVFFWLAWQLTSQNLLWDNYGGVWRRTSPLWQAVFPCLCSRAKLGQTCSCTHLALLATQQTNTTLSISWRLGQSHLCGVKLHNECSFVSHTPLWLVS